MRLITLLFSASLFVAMAACQNQAAEKKAGDSTPIDQNTVTTIQWIDSVLDKGSIAEGQKIEVAFRFKNSGKKPLVIRSVQPSCGCTVADFPKEPIAPGGEGVIKGTFDSKGKPGPNIKTMTVFANTEGHENHLLSFSVNVQKKD